MINDAELINLTILGMGIVWIGLLMDYMGD